MCVCVWGGGGGAGGQYKNLKKVCVCVCVWGGGGGGGMARPPFLCLFSFNKKNISNSGTDHIIMQLTNK